MPVSRTPSTKTIRVALGDTAGAECLDHFRRDLGAALSQPSLPIVVDLAGADVLDSALLAAILVASREATTAGRAFTVLAPPRIYHGLTEWRLDTVLGISEAPIAH